MRAVVDDINIKRKAAYAAKAQANNATIEEYADRLSAIVAPDGAQSAALGARVAAWVISTAVTFVSIPVFGTFVVLCHRDLSAPPQAQ